MSVQFVCICISTQCVQTWYVHHYWGRTKRKRNKINRKLNLRLMLKHDKVNRLVWMNVDLYLLTVYLHTTERRIEKAPVYFILLKQTDYRRRGGRCYLTIHTNRSTFCTQIDTAVGIQIFTVYTVCTSYGVHMYVNRVYKYKYLWRNSPWQRQHLGELVELVVLLPPPRAGSVAGLLLTQLQDTRQIDR